MTSVRIARDTARAAILVACGVLFTGCGGPARLPLESGVGSEPALPPPDTSLIPVVQVAKAIGWRNGQMPTPASGLEVTAFARGLSHPRWLLVLPNGDVLVAETNAPPRPKPGVGGLKGWFFARYQKKAGGAVPSADRITLLRDADGDGIAEIRSPLVERLHSPFGMALVGDTLYIANTDAIVTVPYARDSLRVVEQPREFVKLPAGERNHHWTRNLIASPDGSRLYVGVGSNSNAADHGMDEEENRAAVWEIDRRTGDARVFASGLRNPVGLAWEPESSRLWVAVNERDELGSDLVPDYMTALQDGGFYGWPYSYFGGHVDERVKPQRPDLVDTAVTPDYALGPHTASLGLAWSPASASGLPETFRNGMFVGQHGSWNRKPPSGYRVIFVPFANGHPAGNPIEVLTGFLSDTGKDAMGRPVGVAVDATGALLVADDVGNVVWRVRSKR